MLDILKLKISKRHGFTAKDACFSQIPSKNLKTSRCMQILAKSFSTTPPGSGVFKCRRTELWWYIVIQWKNPSVGLSKGVCIGHRTLTTITTKKHSTPDNTWHLTPDKCYLTPDTWNLTCDTWWGRRGRRGRRI